MEDALDNQAGPRNVAALPRKYTKIRKRVLEEAFGAEWMPEERNQEEHVPLVLSSNEDNDINQPSQGQAINQGQNAIKDLKLKLPKFKGKKNRDP